MGQKPQSICMVGIEGHRPLKVADSLFVESDRLIEPAQVYNRRHLPRLQLAGVGVLQGALVPFALSYQYITQVVVGGRERKISGQGGSEFSLCGCEITLFYAEQTTFVRLFRVLEVSRGRSGNCLVRSGWGSSRTPVKA